MKRPGSFEISGRALAALQTTVRNVTETLAHELASPSTAAPDWSEEQWVVARAVAALHGVSPLLSRTLRWSGPESWHRFLDVQREHTEKRHARLQQLLAVFDHEARSRGLPLVALKGAALHAHGIYQPGERPMSDIDLLAPIEGVQRTAAMLRKIGFQEAFSTSRHTIFMPCETHGAQAFAEHADNPIKIELHDQLRESLPIRGADITHHVIPRGAAPGLNDYASRAGLLAHLLLHAAGNMCAHSIRLLHLIDIARLCMRMTDQDWRELTELAADVRAWWARPPLELTSRYFSSVPERVRRHPALACPRLLGAFTRRQTLTDLSFSNLKLLAFPGIEWSQSLAEATSYMRQRLLPSTETIAGRVRERHEQPCLRAGSWGRLSQGRRVLKWIFARPGRPASLFAIQEARVRTF